jgi:lysophospholipase L1-like esterase
MLMHSKLLLLKLALAPILLWQGKHTRAQTIRLPEAEAERNGLVGVVGETYDQAPYRLLVIGDSSAAGVGAGTQSEALAFQTATALAQQLQRPVAWQLIAQSGVNTAQAHELFDTTPAQPADAVLFALGVNDATSQTKAGAFITNTAALWNTVNATTNANIAVFSGLPPVHQFPALPQPLRFYLGAWAQWLDQSLQRWTQQNNFLYCPIAATLGNASVADMAGDGYHPGPRIYAAWGQQAAQLIATRIQAECL